MQLIAQAELAALAATVRVQAVQLPTMAQQQQLEQPHLAAMQLIAQAELAETVQLVELAVLAQEEDHLLVEVPYR
jgi:hypothetical protein